MGEGGWGVGGGRGVGRRSEERQARRETFRVSGLFK